MISHCSVKYWLDFLLETEQWLIIFLVIISLVGELVLISTKKFTKSVFERNILFINVTDTLSLLLILLVSERLEHFEKIFAVIILFAITITVTIKFVYIFTIVLHFMYPKLHKKEKAKR